MRISDWSSDVCSSDLVCHFHPFGGVRCLSTSRKQWICSAFRSTPSGRSVVVAPMVLKSFLRADLRALAYAMRSEERRVGKGCVSTFRSRVSPYLSKKKHNMACAYQPTSLNKQN